ncbi:MAG: hypothetical protein ACFCU2_09175 [Acidimicrobiia bacterium]
MGTGWSRARLQIGDQSIEPTASYLSDALGDLLAGLVLLVEGASHVEVSWDEEPGEFRWLLARTSAGIAHVRILWFDELWGRRSNEEGRPVFDASCAIMDLIGAVAGVATATFNEWGAAGYREKWVDHDFPEAELVALEDATRAS